MQKRAIVTGASGSLGGVVTAVLTEAGWRVAALGRAAGLDLTQPESARKAIDSTMTSLGGAEALVHLVGAFAAGGAVEQTPPQVWEDMWRMNFESCLFTLQAALPHMQRAGYGRIVAIGALAGEEGPAGLGAYATSKAALHALIRVAANENGDRGIRINAILPSTLDTPTNRAQIPDGDFSKWVQPRAVAERILDLISDEALPDNGTLIAMRQGLGQA
jgi:NAD(P)-dependent dehydrogenase (short-subunit alcohol dehydrogenase family)